jgi:hypothetical protein
VQSKQRIDSSLYLKVGELGLEIGEKLLDPLGARAGGAPLQLGGQLAEAWYLTTLQCESRRWAIRWISAGSPAAMIPLRGRPAGRVEGGEEAVDLAAQALQGLVAEEPEHLQVDLARRLKGDLLGASPRSSRRSSREPPRSRSAAAILAGVIGLEMKASMPASQAGLAVEVRGVGGRRDDDGPPGGGLDGPVAGGDLGPDQARQVPVQEGDVVEGAWSRSRAATPSFTTSDWMSSFRSTPASRSRCSRCPRRSAPAAGRAFRTSGASPFRGSLTSTKGISAQKVDPSPGLDSTPTRPPILVGEEAADREAEAGSPDVAAGRLKPGELREEGGDLRLGHPGSLVAHEEAGTRSWKPGGPRPRSAFPRRT